MFYALVKRLWFIIRWMVMNYTWAYGPANIKWMNLSLRVYNQRLLSPCNALLQVHVSAQIKTNIVYISNKFPRLRPMNHVSGFSEIPRGWCMSARTQMFSLWCTGRAIMKMRFFTAFWNIYAITNEDKWEYSVKRKWERTFSSSNARMETYSDAQWCVDIMVRT